MSSETTPKRPLRHGVARKIRLLLVDKPGESGRQHMSEAELGRLLGWSQTYIARRMRGLNDFTLDDLDAIAAVFDVPITDLFPRADRVTDTYPALASVGDSGMVATALPIPIKRAPASPTRTSRTTTAL